MKLNNNIDLGFIGVVTFALKFRIKLLKYQWLQVIDGHQFRVLT